MMYYRCKCGKKEAWAASPPHDCDGCVHCKTTLETDSRTHKSLGQHDWVTMYDEYTGKPYKRCKRCMQTIRDIEQIQIQG